MSKTYLGDGSDDGTVLGRSATDKIAFYNAAPVVRPAHIADVATAGSATAAANATASNSILAHMRTLGLIASS